MGIEFEPRKCVVCGKEFMPKRRNHVCCNKECSFKKWKIENGYVFESDMKKCIICGTEFKQKSTRHLCCSEKCSRKRNAIQQYPQYLKRYHDKREKEKAQEAMPKSNHDAIANITITARAEGLSYGQYEANKRAKMVKIVRKW